MEDREERCETCRFWKPDPKALGDEKDTPEAGDCHRTAALELPIVRTVRAKLTVVGRLEALPLPELDE